MTPRVLFRSFATAEAFTWAGLITALILRATDVGNFVPIAGGIHGFIFLSYCVVTVFTWVNQRWGAGTGVLGLCLAIVPLRDRTFEITLDKKGKLSGPWRLRPGGDAPKGFVEHVQAWVLRFPWLSVGILLVGVIVVFSVLLWLGPPIPKG